MTDLRQFGEMALVLPLNIAYKESGLDMADYFPFEYLDNFHFQKGNDIVFCMHELNDFYSDMSVVGFLKLIEESDWFTVYDTYYVQESPDKLRSMNVDEAEQYYLERTDIAEFLHWMKENDYEEEVGCYLTDLANDLEEKSGIERIIIEL